MRHGHRKPDAGMALLATLVMVLIIAGLVATLQARSLGTQSTLSRLAQRHDEALALDAVFERARLLVADRLTAEAGQLPLTGEAVKLEQNGFEVSLSVQDAGGLINLWFATPDLLALLPGAPQDIGSRRDRLIEDRWEGKAFLSSAQVLAGLGLGFPERTMAEAFVTLQGVSGQINPGTAPAPLRDLILQYAPAALQIGQTQTVRVAVSIEW